jgi:hypothetical protein
LATTSKREHIERKLDSAPDAILQEVLDHLNGTFSKPEVVNSPNAGE